MAAIQVTATAASLPKISSGRDNCTPRSVEGYGLSKMKKPSEIAAEPLCSADQHKRTATRVKRVAGSLRTEISRAEISGLSPDELATLSKAAAILDELGTNYAKAAALKKRAETEFEKLRLRVDEDVRKQFASVSSIADQVCLIAAALPYAIKPGVAPKWTVRDLTYYMGEAIDSLVYSLTKNPQGRSPDILAKEAWEKFQGHRATIELQHSDAIAALGALSPPA